MLRNSTQCVSACPIGTVSVLRTCVPGCQALREGDYVWPTTLAGLSSTQLCPPRYVNQVVRTCVFGSPSFWSPVDYSACRLLSEALGAISVNLTTVAISSSTLRAILDVPRNHVNISVGDLHATSAIFSNITKIVLDNRNNSRGNNGSGFIPLTNSAISNITLDLLISVSSVMSLSSTNGTSSFISIQQFQTETGRFPSPISPPPLFFSQPASPDNMISRIEGIGSLLIAGNSSVSLGNASLSVSVGGGIEIFGDGSFSSPDLQLFSVNVSAPTSGSPAEFLTVTSFGTGRDMSSGDTLTPPQFLSVDIPSSVFVQVQNQTNQPSTLFTFMTTPHTPLFTDTSLNPVTQFIGTPVVTLNFVVPQQNNSSSFVTASVTNLTTPIALSFTHGPIVNGSNNTRFIRSCVWYDYNSTDWRSEGCSVSFASVDSTGCECNHATSFAVLFSLDDSVSDSATLEIFTIIGCALSMAGTLFTFLTFTLIPSLRKPTLRPILCLCVSLFAVNLIFIVGVIPSNSTSVEGCRAAGALIHYFLLVTFALMFVIVIQLLRAIVFLVTDTERNFWTLFALCFCKKKTFFFF